jgi:hypothetical protein
MPRRSDLPTRPLITIASLGAPTNQRRPTAENTRAVTSSRSWGWSDSGCGTDRVPVDLPGTETAGAGAAGRRWAGVYRAGSALLCVAIHLLIMFLVIVFLECLNLTSKGCLTSTCPPKRGRSTTRHSRGLGSI